MQLMLVLLEVHRWLSMRLPSTQQDAERASAKVAADSSGASPLPPLPKAYSCPTALSSHTRDNCFTTVCTALLTDRCV